MISRNRKMWCRLSSVAITIPLVMLGIGAWGTVASAATATISLPTDEGPHNTTDEWWYTTGHLTGTDPSGTIHNYGYEYVVFKIGPSTFPVTSAYVAQLAITDLTTGAHVEDQRIAGDPDQFPPGGGFTVPVGDWRFSGRAGANTIDAALANDSYGVQLTTSSTIPPALHGTAGLIPYGPFGTSYYYSYTNMHVSGVVDDHGVPVTVSGDGWFDHQWFNTLPVTAGWDWFSVELSNGTQYMVYLIRDSSGRIVQRVGTLVGSGGLSVNLAPASVSDAELGTWTSPHSGQTYSSGWNLAVPGGSLTIEPLVLDQEMNMLPVPRYWEGDCGVTGTVDGAPVTGHGYTEILPPQLMIN